MIAQDPYSGLVSLGTDIYEHREAIAQNKIVQEIGRAIGEPGYGHEKYTKPFFNRIGEQFQEKLPENSPFKR